MCLVLPHGAHCVSCYFIRIVTYMSTDQALVSMVSLVAGDI